MNSMTDPGPGKAAAASLDQLRFDHEGLQRVISESSQLQRVYSEQSGFQRQISADGQNPMTFLHDSFWMQVSAPCSFTMRG